MSRETPKFVQISADHGRVYALDEEGKIWYTIPNSDIPIWTELPIGEYAGFFSNKLNRKPYSAE